MTSRTASRFSCAGGPAVQGVVRQGAAKSLRISFVTWRGPGWERGPQCPKHLRFFSSSRTSCQSEDSQTCTRLPGIFPKTDSKGQTPAFYPVPKGTPKWFSDHWLASGWLRVLPKVWARRGESKASRSVFLAKCFCWRPGVPRPNNHTFSRDEWFFGLAGFLEAWDTKAKKPHLFKRRMFFCLAAEGGKARKPVLS